MSLAISFKGKKVLITGAARGLGRSLVEKLHAQNAIIIAVSRNPDNLAKLEKEFPGITTVACDLSNWDETRKTLAGFVNGVEYLINNAGVVHVQPFLDVTEENFDSMWDTNVKGVVNVSQMVVEDMIKRGKGGCVINVSSMGGKLPSQSLGIYDSTKSALDMLTKTMAVELGQFGIRVNSINPTMFETDMTKGFLERNSGGGAPFLQRTPLRRMAESWEIVNATLFLMSDYASFINAGSLLVDGGYAAN